MQDIWEGSRIIMRGYDSLWKVERNLYHRFLNVNKAARYIPYQDLETKQLIVDLLRKPAAFEELITRSTLSMATSMAYGFRVLDPQSAVMQELFKNTHGFFMMVSSSKLFDWYPQLRPIARVMPTWLYPLASKAKQVFYRERAQFRQLYEDTKRASQLDNSLPSKSQILKLGPQLLNNHFTSQVFRLILALPRRSGKALKTGISSRIMQHRTLQALLWKEVRIRQAIH
jgi:hypothetical protein